MNKQQLLTEWGQVLAQNIMGGQVTGRPVGVTEMGYIDGPRAGAVCMRVGFEAGKVLKSLARDDFAMLRQTVPWTFLGNPQVMFQERFLRCEAGWPLALSTQKIPLSSLGSHPTQNGSWVLGLNEYGYTVTGRLSNRTPHWLVAGTSGSGKSVALRGAVIQWSRDPQNQIVLLDGKSGESLRALQRLQGVVGPVAMDIPAARGALSWAAAEMAQRNAEGHDGSRIIVVMDELERFTEDPGVARLLDVLTADGRSAALHCMVSTHHPRIDSFGSKSTARNLAGRVALVVSDAPASQVAIGDKFPRADRLLGCGDSYALGPGVCHRTQVAYVDEVDIARAPTGQWLFDEWPETMDVDPDQVVSWSYTGQELAISLVSAAEEEGRTRMCHRFQEAGLSVPGSDRAVRVMHLGRDELTSLREMSYDVCLPGAYEVSEVTETAIEVVCNPPVWGQAGRQEAQ